MCSHKQDYSYKCSGESGTKAGITVKGKVKEVGSKAALRFFFMNEMYVFFIFTTSMSVAKTANVYIK